MQNIIKGLSYEQFPKIFGNREQIVHIIKYNQKENTGLTLLISKVSEAILPNTPNNHVGEGSTFDNFMTKQKGVRFIINGGFNHYRKGFYDWSHQSFNVGDPVGLVKIRNHFFEDYIDLEYYGFLVQEKKGKPWNILTREQVKKDEKYILGCTPLLIFNGKSIQIPEQVMSPLEPGKINPPSILAHGLQRHPRTAIGLKGDNLYFITVEGKNNLGCNLLELQDIGVTLKLDSLLNLDGGGSSQFRLITSDNIIKNYVNKQDESRILGHALVIFDKNL